MKALDPRLEAFLIDALRVSMWLAILVVIFVPLERLFAVRPQKVVRKQFFIDVGYYFLSSLLPAVLLSGPVGLLAWAVRRAMPAAVLETAAAWPFWARLLAAQVAGEVGYYWGHRWSHTFPFLWKFHSIHHSAEHVDFLVSSRAHPVDFVFSRFCGLLPIFVLGLAGPGLAGTEVAGVVTFVSVLWGFFIHANLRWRFGPLEWLVSTPAFHHWHHTRTGPINRNYSSTLPWIDWLFGTLHLPRKEWPAEYGIEAKLPQSLVGQLAYPLRVDPPRAGDGAEPAVAAGQGLAVQKVGEESGTAP